MQSSHINARQTAPMFALFPQADPAELAVSGSAAAAALAVAANATLIPRALAIPNLMFLCATAFGTAANWAALVCMASLPTGAAALPPAVAAAGSAVHAAAAAPGQMVVARRVLLLATSAILFRYATWLIKLGRNPDSVSFQTDSAVTCQ